MSESRSKPLFPSPEELLTEDLLVAVAGSGRAGILASRYAVADLVGRSMAELVSDGLPPPAARRLASAFEMSRRLASGRTTRGRIFTSSTVIFEAFGERLRRLQVEQFWVVLVDAKNRMTGEVLISQGSLTSTTVHPREVFKPAIRASASGVICLHNHPSGDPEPSDLDHDLTRRLVSVGELIGIRVLDHIVVGDGAYVSFLERALIPV